MRLRTIGLISTLALGLFAGPLPAAAQQAGKVYRIGYLSGRGARGGASYNAFRQQLRELGYVEGQNLVIKYRSVPAKGGRLRDRAREPAAELVRLKVDVIVIRGAPSMIRALQQATRTIPIVTSGALVDPVKAGFVDSLARPGGNITGLYILESKLHGKRLQLLKEAFPQISRVVIVLPPPRHKHVMKEVEAVGQALGIQIQSLVVRRMDKLESVFSAISQERPDALLGAVSTFVRIYRSRIIEFAAKRQLPTMGSRSRFVDAGGLMSYGTDRYHMVRRAATYVAKILKGAKPADLPIEQPTKFDFVVNLKTANALGLTIPPAVLLQATKVVK